MNTRPPAQPGDTTRRAAGSGANQLGPPCPQLPAQPRPEAQRPRRPRAGAVRRRSAALFPWAPREPGGGAAGAPARWRRRRLTRRWSTSRKRRNSEREARRGEGGGRVRRLPAQRLGCQARPALLPRGGVVSPPARAGLRGPHCLPSAAASEPWGCCPPALGAASPPHPGPQRVGRGFLGVVVPAGARAGGGGLGGTTAPVMPCAERWGGGRL